jgi:quinoprotein glucose dehydrogenase
MLASLIRSELLTWGIAVAALTLAPGAGRSPLPPAHEWPSHGGNREHTQHSPLAMIHRGNVARLKVAWIYRTGDARTDGRSQIQCNPIVVGGVLYATSPGLKAIALDAATGKELWRFDPFALGSEQESLGDNRGGVFRSDGADQRIPQCGPFLFALDARGGSPCRASRGGAWLREGSAAM